MTWTDPNLDPITRTPDGWTEAVTFRRMTSAQFVQVKRRGKELQEAADDFEPWLKFLAEILGTYMLDPLRTAEQWYEETTPATLNLLGLLVVEGNVPGEADVKKNSDTT